MKLPPCILSKMFILTVLFFTSSVWAEHFTLSPDSMETQLPIVLSNLEDNDIISIPAGKFKFTRALNVVARKIQIIGAGSAKSVLDFSTQKDGAQAILVRGWDISLKGFSILAPIGDGLVIRNSARISLDDIHVDMNRPEASTNGAYAFYPVRSQHISMQNLSATGASDAGIYLGQAKFAKIVDSEAYQNVTGINIENSVHVYVESNHLHHNAIGVFTTSLPDMIYPYSEDIQFENNLIEKNNGDNFSTKGTLINRLKPGIGMLLIATHEARLSNNRFDNNKLKDLLISDYYYLQQPPHPGTFNPTVGKTILAENSLNIPLSIKEKQEKKLCNKATHTINYTTPEGRELKSLKDKCNEESVSSFKVQQPEINNSINQ